VKVTLHAALYEGGLAKFAEEKQMPRKKPSVDVSVGAATPSQEDETDIVDEIGATPAEDGSGDLEIEETKLRGVGAVDAESVRENRRNEEMVNKVRSGQKGVRFNIDNIPEKYDTLTKTWPPNTIDIFVKRMTGTPVEWVIQSHPRSGSELYAAIMAQHGRYEEAEYNIVFIDTVGKQRRGTGRIVLPDTRDTPPIPLLQGQPVSQYQPQYSAPAAQAASPAVDPVDMMSRMFGMFQQMQVSAQRPAPVPVAPAAPVPVPIPQVMMPQQPTTDPMAMMGRAFEMFQKMQQSAQPAPQAPQSPPQPSTDPMAVMQESFRLFQQMQQPQSVTAPSPPPPPQGSDPVAMMAWMQQMFQQQKQQPATPPPPDPMEMMGRMFEMFQKMQQAVQPPPPVREPYQRQYQGDNQQPRYQPPHAQNRHKSAAEEFQEAASVIDLAMSLTDRFRPPPAPEPEPRSRYNPEDGDDSPVKVVDVAGWPVIVNKDDGSARKWETGVANMGNILKWIGDQREAILKAQSERQAKQRQQEQLPPGYVEVGPGYKPPPGYVAVPVDQLGPSQGLPPPPDNMPPPINQQQEVPAPAPKRAQWGAPTMPETGG
jgi:hypothetical protein